MFNTLLPHMSVAAPIIANPTSVLHLLQSSTYAFASVLSRRAGRKELCACYATSAFIHGLLGACHLFSLDDFI
jgi:hypothetical protein